MKRDFRKIISILLVIILALLCVGMLSACNKNKRKNAEERDRQARTQSVAIIKNNFLHGLNEKWAVELENGGSENKKLEELNDDQVAELDDAGEYIVTAGWTQLVCDVLSASALQTAKLESLASAVESDEGRALMADFSQNAELLVTLAKRVSFTEQDIAGLVYDLLYALVDKSGSTIDAMQNRLGTIKRRSGLRGQTIYNINVYSANLNVARSKIVPTKSEKDKMLAAFSDAYGPLSDLVAFAYTTSSSATDSGIFDVLFTGGGALSDISNSEIITLANALLGNVSNLKTSLDGDSLSKLNKALSLIIEKFDTKIISSVLYAQIVKYAKYAYMVVDVIPVVCDIVTVGGGMLKDTEFITQIKNVIANSKTLNEETQAVNFAIIMSKMLIEVMNKFDEQELCDIIENACKRNGKDYQKAVPFLLLDAVLNISSLLSDSIESGDDFDFTAIHPDVMDAKTLGIMLSTVFFLNSNLDRLKQTYYEYTIGEKKISDLKNIAVWCSFADFGIEERTLSNNSSSEQVKEWYEYYMTEGLSKINDVVSDCIDKAVEDIKLYINEFYEEGSDSHDVFQTIADWQLLSKNISETELLEKLEVMKRGAVLRLFALLITMK